MRKAYDAIKAIYERQGAVAGVHWEVYGDWSEDPAQLQTDGASPLSAAFPPLWLQEAATTQSPAPPVASKRLIAHPGIQDHPGGVSD